MAKQNYKEALIQNVHNTIPLEISSILELQKILEVSCKIENSKIIYFLSFPINYDQQYDLIYLKSIPSSSELGFTTVIPKVHYFLKSEKSLKPLNNICELGKPYQCFQRNVNNNLKECERQILQNEKPESCTHITLEIQENYVDYIPQINMFIIVFPFSETIKLELENEIEIKELKGIFLIESNKGNLIFRNEILNFSSKTSGKPTILENVNVKFGSEKLSDFKIRIHDLNLDDIKLNQLTPANRDVQSLDNSLNPWKILMCITLSVSISSLILIIRKSNLYLQILRLFKKREPENVLPQINLACNSSTNLGINPNPSLPGDAKF